MYEIIIALIGSFFIGLIVTGFGLGVGLVIVPIFALFFAPAEVNSLVVSMVLIADLFTIHRYRGKQSMKNIIRILPFLIVGIIIGSFILSSGSPYLKLLIGVLCFFFSILQFLSIRGLVKFRVPDRLSPVVGVSAGIVSAIAQVGSLLVTIYLSQKNFTKETFLSTLSILFLFTNIAKFISYASLGVMALSTLSTSLLSIPLIGLGSYAGYGINKRVGQESFFSIIMILAMILSSIVIVSSF